MFYCHLSAIVGQVLVDAVARGLKQFGHTPNGAGYPGFVVVLHGVVLGG